MLNRLRTLLLLSLLLALTASAAWAGLGDIHPWELPTELAALEDTLTLRWTENLPCVLMAGSDPGQLDTPVFPLSSVPGELSFQALTGGLGAGVWAAALVSLDGLDSSLPFFIFLEADNAPVMVAPQNGGLVPPGSVQLSWEPVLGVPYYHVVLSDQEIVIDEDANGDTVISGANIIWQAIVPATTALYGSWDPSGFFNEMNGTPPPLVPGPDYNWIVLNNYGNNPVLTSSRQAGVASFTVIDDSGLEAPNLLLPAAGDTLSGDWATFTWSTVIGASHYHYYLSRIVDSDESQGAVGVFDQITGQTLLDLPAPSLLVDSRYQWKVFALDESGQGVSSASREFVYEIAMGELKIRTRNENGDAIPQVQIQVTPLGAGGSTLPVITGNSGGWNDDLVPGDYHLAASKDGHESAEATATVTVGQLSEVTLVLPTSPATLAGNVRNESGTPIPFASVSASEDQTGETRQVASGASGAFQLGVSAGDWTLGAGKSGYHAQNSVSMTATPGSYLELPIALLLAPNSSSLSGQTLSAGGLPVVAVLVTATRDDGQSSQSLTGSDGLFVLNLDAGNWTVSANKAGYVSPTPRDVNLDSGEDFILDPALVLGAQAAILSGFVRAAGGVVGNATVTAVPSVGAALSVASGPQGAWQLSLAPGTWNLGAAKTGYSAGAPLQLTLTPGDSQSGLMLELQANPCSVSGQVSDGLQGLAGATVGGGGQSILSDWNGAYTITLPAGSQELTAWLSSYSSGSPLQLDLSPGQVLTGVGFVLSPNAATLSGRVFSAGFPVAGASIFVESVTGSLQRTSDASGDYTVSLAPGSYEVRAEKAGMDPSAVQSVTCGPGQEIPNRDFELTPATVLLSGLVGSGGEALRDAQITALAAGGSFGTGSALDGGWTLQVPAGEIWTVSVGKSGYASQAVETPLLNSGATWSRDFVMVPQPAQLLGQVRDEGGYPVPDILVTGGDASAATDAAGVYELGLAPGSVQVLIEAAGYAPFQQQLPIVAGENNLDIVLDALFATLAGTVRNTDGQPLSGATLNAAGAEGSGSATSDGQGHYQLPRLFPGAVLVTATLTGHSSDSRYLDLAAEEAAQFDFVLEALTGSLAGQVLNDAGAPLAGVGLQLRDGSTLLAQGYSTATGVFVFNGLPTDRPLNLYASLEGHSALSGNPLSGLLAPLTGLDFTLAADVGLLQGLVQDAATNLPIAGATLAADDGQGYFGQAISDTTGAFRIAGLRRNSLYTLTADAPGWASRVFGALSPGDSDVAVALTASPGRIFGTLSSSRDEASRLPDNSRLRGIPSEGGQDEVSLALDDFGAFSLEGLCPGEYTLLFQVDGHLTEPRSLTVALAEGQDAGSFDFELLASPLAALTLMGEDELDNDGSALFRGAQSTASGEQVNYPLSWSLSPAMAGTLDAATGRFSPRDDFFGPITLSALHESSGLQASKTVHVFARLSSDTGRLLDDGLGLRLSVPAGSVAQDQRITVQRQLANPLKRRAGAFRVEGRIYHFLPDGLQFDAGSQPELTLPLPNAVFNKRLAIGWWDPTALSWERLEGRKDAAGLHRDLPHFSDYALLVANESLGVQSARLVRNPFSPAAGGAEIRFTLSSQEMAAPPVDVTIFNLLGDPVRRLAERVALPVGIEQTMIWDGLSEAGELARNGRYLIRIRVYDNSGDEEALLQAVLIK